MKIACTECGSEEVEVFLGAWTSVKNLSDEPQIYIVGTPKWCKKCYKNVQIEIIKEPGDMTEEKFPEVMVSGYGIPFDFSFGKQ